jgi:hypothetical protein
MLINSSAWLNAAAGNQLMSVDFDATRKHHALSYARYIGWPSNAG